MKIEEKLAVAYNISQVENFLEDAVGAGFISRPEATVIFKDILKETGFKKADEVKVAQEKGEK